MCGLLSNKLRKLSPGILRRLVRMEYFVADENDTTDGRLGELADDSDADAMASETFDEVFFVAERVPYFD